MPTDSRLLQSKQHIKRKITRNYKYDKQKIGLNIKIV